MNDVTRILSAIEKGDPSAAEQLLPLVYEELKKLAAARLANERPGQTLQATALVHEAYLRLVGPSARMEREEGRGRKDESEGSATGTLAALPPRPVPFSPSPLLPSAPPQWDGRGHFYAAAAEAMRRILIDRACDKKRIKRGGGWRRLSLDHVAQVLDEPSTDLLTLNEALERLAVQDQLSADLVKLRFFAGLTLDQAAGALGIGSRTADRYWKFARSWLYDELRRDDDDAGERSPKKS